MDNRIIADYLLKASGCVRKVLRYCFVFADLLLLFLRFVVGFVPSPHFGVRVRPYSFVYVCDQIADHSAVIQSKFLKCQTIWSATNLRVLARFLLLWWCVNHMFEENWAKQQKLELWREVCQFSFLLEKWQTGFLTDLSLQQKFLFSTDFSRTCVKVK